MKKRNLVLIVLIALIAFGCKPIITSTSPESPATIISGQTQEFTVEATGKDLVFQWYLDGTQESSSTNEFVFTPDMSDTGNHVLEVIVSNSDGQVSYEWEIEVVLFDLGWEETLGGSGNDTARSIIQTEDLGYIVTGESDSTNIPGTTSTGGKDYLTIKLDNTGDVEWQKLFGGSGNDIAYSVCAASSGGYIVAGVSDSEDTTCVNHGNKDFYLVKTDENGNVEWEKMYGTAGNDYARSIQPTQDGGYIIAGYTCPTILQADGMAIKIDSAGTVEWTRTYTDGGIEHIMAVRETVDNLGQANGYILSGAKNGLSHYVIRTDITGNKIWDYLSNIFEYTGGGSNDILQTSSGEFLSAGFSTKEYSSGGGSSTTGEALTIKLDASGNEKWTSNTGGTSTDLVMAAQELPQGNGFIIAGTTESEEIPGCSGGIQCDGFDVYIGILDSWGNCVFQQRHGGLGTTDSGLSIATCNNALDDPDGFIIAGQYSTLSGHDFYVIKIDM